MFSSFLGAPKFFSAVGSGMSTGRAWLRPRSCDSAAFGEDRLAAHQAPDVIDHLDKGRTAGEAGIVLVKADLDDLLDVARAGRHHGYPLGEKHRLMDIMRDEDHGLARALPEVEE